MAIDIRKCKVCGDEFFGSKNAIYCSPKCKQRGWRELSKKEASKDKLNQECGK